MVGDKRNTRFRQESEKEATDDMEKEIKKKKKVTKMRKMSERQTNEKEY